MLRRDVVLAVATLVMLGAASFAAPEDPLPQLQATDAATRERASRKILAERDQLVAGLIALARQATTPEPHKRGRQEVPSYPYREPKHLAIELLGELRASEAVEVLLGNLTYCNPVMYGSYRTWESDFPAAVSLSEIGNPALGPALAKVARTDDELERELCCWIIERVEGEELAPIVLQLAIDKERYSGGKARLQAALEYLQKQK